MQKNDILVPEVFRHRYECDALAEFLGRFDVTSEALEEIWRLDWYILVGLSLKEIEPGLIADLVLRKIGEFGVDPDSDLGELSVRVCELFRSERGEGVQDDWSSVHSEIKSRLDRLANYSVERVVQYGVLCGLYAVVHLFYRGGAPFLVLTAIEGLCRACAVRVHGSVRGVECETRVQYRLVLSALKAV